MAVDKSTPTPQLSFNFDKPCACCRRLRPTSCFGRSRNRRDGLQPYCNECKAQKAKNRYFKDHAETLRKRAEYASAHKDEMLAYSRKWRENNRDQHNAINRRWAKTYPERANARYKRYQMTKRNRVPSWANLTAIKVFYAEAHRLSRETGIKHHVDHIVPLQSTVVSGLHCEANLQVIPQALNWSKSNSYWPDMP